MLHVLHFIGRTFGKLYCEYRISCLKKKFYNEVYEARQTYHYAMVLEDLLISKIRLSTTLPGIYAIRYIEDPLTQHEIDTLYRAFVHQHQLNRDVSVRINFIFLPT